MAELVFALPVSVEQIAVVIKRMDLAGFGDIPPS